MAITQRVGPHDAWIVVDGASYQCLEGEAIINSQESTNTIDGRVPLNAPGYMEGLAGVSMGAKCEAVVMTADGTATLCVADVAKIDFDLTGGVIWVHARGQMDKLNDTKDWGSYKDQTTGQVAQTCAEKAGCVLNASGSSVMAGVKVKDNYVRIHDGQSVKAVISQMAKFDGARYFEDPLTGVITYKAGTAGGSLGGGSYEVFWKKPEPGSFMVSDCISLHVVHNVKFDGINPGDSKSWQPYEKQKVETGGGGGGNGGGGSSGGGAQKGPILDQAAKDFAQNQAIAKAASDNMGAHAWELRAIVAGDPSIKADMDVVLTGSGVFDMTYPIDKVIHRFGYNGFTTTINGKSKGSGGGGGGGG